MNKYLVKFVGKLNNALGICYEIQDEVIANEPTKELILEKLYENYESIRYIISIELIQ